MVKIESHEVVKLFGKCLFIYLYQRSMLEKVLYGAILKARKNIDLKSAFY